MKKLPLGQTGMSVSALGLGTVKFGRNQQVKYPSHFDLPSDRQVADLLALAADLGINLIDTAPAYGSSQQRLGKLLTGRQNWIIVSKVGEVFESGRSHFDFSYAHTVASVENSLRTLHTDYLDVVLIHSDGNDLAILQHEGVVDALESLKQRGLIRAHGMSSKTVDGGIQVVENMDVVMATCNPAYQQELTVLQRAAELQKGVLVKKGLQSGHVPGQAGVDEAMAFVFSRPAVSSMIVGTINPSHLQANAQSLHRALS